MIIFHCSNGVGEIDFNDFNCTEQDFDSRGRLSKDEDDLRQYFIFLLGIDLGIIQGVSIFMEMEKLWNGFKK